MEYGHNFGKLQVVIAMRRYLGIITEVLRHEILVEAENEVVAHNMLEKLYRDEDVVLGAEDLVDMNLEIKAD